jgi:outer membrane receptor protein involved in Fe transport
VSLGAPLGAAAQDPAPDAPENAPDAPEAEPAEKEGDDWMTEDVAGTDDDVGQEDHEDQTEGEPETDEGEDVDEIVIEYDETGEADKVTDAEGREIEDVEMPVVSKAVEVQDPDDLEPGADKETGVQGQVVSRRPKKVLPDAPVLAKGREDGRLRSTLTDERGRYRLYLPPGRYTLRSYYDLYHGARWDNILVARGAFKRVNFVLDPISEKDAGVEEQEIIYLADTTSEAAQLALRKEAVGVADAISSEEIKRAGDSTAKGAVKRVVGVTVDEDGRIIVRGLAGRYNQILLNGVPVPGVDPDVPSVKLDVFPSDIVSNLAVVKVPRPDLPGAFAGGLLMVDTTKYPDELEFKIGASAGFNSISTFQDMPTYTGGKRDWIGFDDGTRELPDLVGGQRLDVGRGGDGSRYQLPDQVAQVGRSFENIWNPRNKKAIPELGLKASVGKSGSIGKNDGRGGFLLSFIYDYDESVKTGFNRRFRFNDEGEPISLLRDFDIKGGNQDVLWGTFGSGFIELNPDNFLNVTSMFSRVSDDQTLTQLGFTEDTGFDAPQTQNSYNFIGRTVFFNQLQGDHRNLGDTKVRFQWNATGGFGRRDEPDRRLIEQFTSDQLVVRATRFFSDLNQYFVGGTGSVKFPVYQAFESTAYLSFGVNGGYQDRDFTARRFVYLNEANSQLIGDPETIFSATSVGRVSRISEVTRIQDSYVASNTLGAGFAQLETPMAPWLRFLGLLRFEAFNQRVRSESPFSGAVSPEDVQETNRTDLDPLPSANFAFTINDEMFVKIGYGMTVIRPAVRELAPFLYRDFIRGWNIEGNPDLRRTRVQNAEARYEYYFGGTDLVAATAFFKYFDDPIEFVVFNQTNSAAGYANADKAWLVGGEVELRFAFVRLHEKLDTLFFTGNVAFMKSKTTLPAGESIAGNLERPLFNQSPYVTNLSLRFDDPDSRVMVGLVYNAFGRRIVEAGGSAGDVVLPDVFELPQHRLDLIASYKPTPHVKLGFKWKNIAFAKKRFEQGGELVLLQNYGTTVSISAEYSY